MKRNMREWQKALIASPVKQAMPILSFPGASLLGVTVDRLVRDASLQAQVMHLVARRTPSCAAVSMMDLSVEAEAFGSTVHFAPDEVPTIRNAVARPDSAVDLVTPRVGAGRTWQYVEAIARACELIDDRPVFSGAIGPYSLAGRLMGVSDIMMDCFDDPQAVHRVLGKATDFLVDYLCAQRNAGANGALLAEPLAGLLSPALAKEFSSPYVARIAKALRAEDFLVIYHNCGNNTPRMMDSILSTDCDGYHFGDAVNLAELVPQVPADAFVMGNISPSSQFLGGTPDSVREATLALMRACSPGYPNFIVSSGCDIPPGAPWENIDAFYEAVAAYYAEKQSFSSRED
ncbi:MAG: uroporphyrinogen decarboxylase family protein [Christensenellales bacterium]|jgi:uroporphyrinogen decarboxylase